MSSSKSQCQIQPGCWWAIISHLLFRNQILSLHEGQKSQVRFILEKPSAWWPGSPRGLHTASSQLTGGQRAAASAEHQTERLAYVLDPSCKDSTHLNAHLCTVRCSYLECSNKQGMFRPPRSPPGADPPGGEHGSLTHAASFLGTLSLPSVPRSLILFRREQLVV